LLGFVSSTLCSFKLACVSAHAVQRQHPLAGIGLNKTNKNDITADSMEKLNALLENNDCLPFERMGPGLQFSANSQFQGTDMDWLDAATVCHCCTAMGHSCVL
jgi:hypothetical protein